jgi:hypothetical protein
MTTVYHLVISEFRRIVWLCKKPSVDHIHERVARGAANRRVAAELKGLSPAAIRGEHRTKPARYQPDSSVRIHISNGLENTHQIGIARSLGANVWRANASLGDNARRGWIYR